MKRLKFLVFICIIGILVACSSNISPIAVSTSQPTEISTSTSQPTEIPTNTPIPLITPTLSLPVSQMTPIPKQNEKVTKDNAKNIKLLAEWGKGRLLTISLSTDGKELLVISAIQATKYRTDNLEKLKEIKYGMVDKAVISTDHSYIALKNGEDIRVLDFTSGDTVIDIQIQLDLQGSMSFEDPTTMLFSPDGQLLVIGSFSGVEIWDMNTHKQRYSLPAFKGNVNGWFLAFSPDNKRLATAPLKGSNTWGMDASLRVWDPLSGSLIYEVKDKLMQGADIYGLVFSADGQKLFSMVRKWDPSSSGDNNIISWATIDGSYLGRFEFNDSAFLKQSLPDGSLISSDGTNVKLIKSDDGFILRTFPLSAEYSNYKELFSYSPEANLLAINMGDGINLMDLNTSNSLIPLGRKITNISSIYAVSGNSNNFIVKTLDNKVFVVDKANSEIIFEIPNPQANLCSAAFSIDGNILAIGSVDSSIYLYNLPDGELKYKLQGHRMPACYMQFSPDSKLLASASADRSIITWNVRNGEKLTQVASDFFHENFLTFSPDSQILVASAGNGIRLWDTNKWNEIGGFQDKKINSYGVILFSEDGKNIIAQPLQDKKLSNEILVIDANTLVKQRNIQLDDNSILFSSSTKSNIRIINTNQGVISTINFLDGDSYEVTPLPVGNYSSFELSVDRNFITGIDAKNQVFQINLSLTPNKLVIPGYFSQINRLQLSMDGRVLAVFTSPDNLYLINTLDGSLNKLFSATNYGEYLLEISPDFKLVVTYKYDEFRNLFDIYTRDISTGKLINQIASTKKTPINARFSPNGNYLVLASYTYGDQADLFLFETDSLKQLFRLQYIGFTGQITYSRDGRKVVVLTQEAIRIIEIPIGKSLGKIQSKGQGFSQSQFTYDETGIIYGIYEMSDKGLSNENLFLYDIDTRKTTELPSTYPSGKYLPDGTLIINTRIKPTGIFDIVSSKQLITLGDLDTYYYDWVFSNDGTLIIGATAFATIQVFGINPN